MKFVIKIKYLQVLKKVAVFQSSEMDYQVHVYTIK